MPLGGGGRSGLLREKRAQVSAELIIIIAALIAVAIVLITQLQRTAATGRRTLNATAEKAFDEISDLVKTGR